jgi:hypothetical protein
MRPADKRQIAREDSPAGLSGGLSDESPGGSFLRRPTNRKFRKPRGRARPYGRLWAWLEAAALALARSHSEALFCQNRRRVRGRRGRGHRPGCQGAGCQVEEVDIGRGRRFGFGGGWSFVVTAAGQSGEALGAEQQGQIRIPVAMAVHHIHRAGFGKFESFFQVRTETLCHRRSPARRCTLGSIS